MGAWAGNCKFMYNPFCWIFLFRSYVTQICSAAAQLLSGQHVRYGKCRRYGQSPSRTKSNLLDHSPPASQAGRRAGPALYPSAPLLSTSTLLSLYSTHCAEYTRKNKGKEGQITAGFRGGWDVRYGGGGWR